MTHFAVSSRIHPAERLHLLRCNCVLSPHLICLSLIFKALLSKLWKSEPFTAWCSGHGLRGGSSACFPLSLRTNRLVPARSRGDWTGVVYEGRAGKLESSQASPGHVFIVWHHYFVWSEASGLTSNISVEYNQKAKWSFDCLPVWSIQPSLIQVKVWGCEVRKRSFTRNQEVWVHL